MPKKHSPVLPIFLLGIVATVLFLKDRGFQTPDVPSLSIPAMSSFPVAKLVTDVNELKLSVHQQVNEYRASQNLPPLQLDSQISQEAVKHSEAMASGRSKFSHDGSKQRFQAVGTKIPYRKIGENLAYNSGYADPGKKAVEGWIASDGHRRNMEGDFNLTGIGIARNAKGEYYFTQIFVRSRSLTF
ncbi:MAG: CAP domain-containing protein [Cyanobacteria bacterium J06592_8]